MIVVLGGWPRSGTSMLMATLAVGGLTPIVDDDDGAKPGYPVGSFQHSGVLMDDTATVLGALARPGTCVKLFPRQMIELCRAGVVPVGTKVLLALRPYKESEQSWDAAFPKASWMPFPEQHVENVSSVRMNLAAAGIPVLDVDFHALVDEPSATCHLIAEFVGGDLDVDAMAAIPNVAHRHFGGPAAE